MRRIAVLLALLAPAGCGGSAEQSRSAPKASAIVDPAGSAPLVNSLEVEPGSGTLLVTTNRGFFRIAPGREPERARGR